MEMSTFYLIESAIVLFLFIDGRLLKNGVCLVRGYEKLFFALICKVKLFIIGYF